MLRKTSFFAAAMVLTGLSQSVQAASAFLTFDNFPTGPSVFIAASPAPQTIVYPQATFTGGVILGNPTAFPAQSFATSPNVYGTCSNSLCGTPTLLETLTITINPSFPVDEVSFPLFNGNSITQSYIVTAFDSSHAFLASQTLSNLAPALSSGFGIVDLMVAGIASVTITPSGSPTNFDFLIDSVALNESVQTAVTPIPAALPLFATGLAGLGLLGWRRKRKTRAAV